MKSKIFLFLIAAVCVVQTAFAQTPVPPSVPPVTTPAVIDNRGYLLGPGDEIKAKVLGEPQFDFEAAVNESGNIEAPFSDVPISAMCKTEIQLKSDIAKSLSKYLRNPQISLRTERKSRPPVIIAGEVRSPQQVVLMRAARLLELLSFSGGETENAGGNIEVFRQSAPMCGSQEAIAEWQAQANNSGGVPSRIYSLERVKTGTIASNPVINAGDIIVVQKATPVYIVGEVRSPQGVYLKNGGLSLTQAIAMVGGVTREAKTKDVRIYRRKVNSLDRETISVNLDMIKKGTQKDVMLEANDQIEVDKTKKSVAQTILEVATGTARAAVGNFGSLLPQRVLY